MAKPQWPILFGTFILSCLALALCLVSLSTANWIVSKPELLNNKTTIISDLNYGLFTGSYLRLTFDPNNPGMYNLMITCLFKENVCVFSCLSSAEMRKEELRALYNGEMPPFTCDRLRTVSSPMTAFENNIEETDLQMKTEEEHHFINAGHWLSTVIFLIFAILLTLACCIVSILNTATNPIENFLSIRALYVWNALTILIDLIVLILWGTLFDTVISKDIAIRDTITGQWSSDGYTNLSFSYWLILPALFLHAINIGLLALRQHLINRDAPTIKGPDAAQSDGAIYLY